MLFYVSLNLCLVKTQSVTHQGACPFHVSHGMHVSMLVAQDSIASLQLRACSKKNACVCLCSCTLCEAKHAHPATRTHPRAPSHAHPPAPHPRALMHPPARQPSPACPPAGPPAPARSRPPAHTQARTHTHTHTHTTHTLVQPPLSVNNCTDSETGSAAG